MQPTQNQRAEWNAIAHEARLSGKDEIWAVAKAAYEKGAEERLRQCANWITQEVLVASTWEKGGEFRRDGQNLALALCADLVICADLKPSSLKQQALRDLDGLIECARILAGTELAYPTTIKEALESIPDQNEND